MDEPCPRCDGMEFTERDCGPDSYEDDVFYISYVCVKCGLWYDGWRDDWFIDVEYWQDVEEADRYSPRA